MLEDITGVIADLTKVSGKQGISLFTDETKQTYKSTYEILKEISERWDEMTDKNQAALLEKLAGKRGGQVVAGLLKNFDAAEKAMQEMENAAGSADAEMEIIQSSIEYKLNAFSQTWVGTLQQLIDRGDIGELVDGLTSISEAFGKIISTGGLSGKIMKDFFNAIGATKMANYGNLSGSLGILLGGYAGMKNSGYFQTVQKYVGIQDGVIKSENVFAGAIKRRAIETQNASIQLNYDRQQLAIYGQMLEDNRNGPVHSTEDLNRALIGTSSAAQNYAVQMKNTGVAASQFAGQIQTATVAQRAMATATRIASAALNAFAIGLLLNLLGKVVQKIQDLIHEQENLAESVKGLMSEYDSAIGKAKNNANTMKELIPIYQKLSKGVDSLGRNVSLTDDEFDEYRSTVNQIADMYPALVEGWTKEGTAIINLRQNVEALTKAYQDEEKAAYRTLIATGKDNNGEDIAKQWSKYYAGYKGKVQQLDFVQELSSLSLEEISKNYKEYQQKYKTSGYSNEVLDEFFDKDYMTKLFSQRNATIDKIGDVIFGEVTETTRPIPKLLRNIYTLATKNLREGYSEIDSKYDNDESYKREIDNQLEQDLKRIHNESNLAKQQLDAAIQGQVKNLREVANAYLNTNELFSDLDADTQAALSRMIYGFDVETIKNIQGQFPESNITDAIGMYVNSIVEKIADNQDAKVALIQMLTLKDSDLPIEEAKATADKYVTLLSEALQIDPVQIKLIFGVDYDQLEANAEEIKNKAMLKFGKNEAGTTGRYENGIYVENLSEDWNNAFNETYDAFIKQNSINTQDELSQFNKLIDEYDTLEEAMTAYTNAITFGKGFTGFTDKQKEKYDSYKSDIDKLNDYLRKVHDDTITPEELMELAKEFDDINISADNLETQIIDLISKRESETLKSIGLQEDAGDELYRKYVQLRDEAKNTGEFTAEYVDVYQEIVKAAKEAGIATKEWLDQRAEKSALLDTLKKITSEAKKATKELNDAFSSIKNSSSALKEFEKAMNEGKIDESILSTVGGLNDELNTLVAGYYGGVVTIEQIYEKLKEVREKDFQAYKEAYVIKMRYDEQYYKTVLEANKEFYDKLLKTEKAAAETSASYEGYKAKIKLQYLGEYAKEYAEFLDQEGEVLLAKYEAMAKIAPDLRGDDAELFMKLSRYKKALDDMKQLGWKDFDITLEGFDAMSEKLDGSKSDYDELFDFFERRLEIINQALEKIDSSLEDVNSAAAKNILLSGKSDIIQEEIKNYSSALQMYQEKANEALAKLNPELQNLIKNGGVNLTRLLGENGETINENLEEYVKWADKVSECNQQLIELKETLRDLALDQFNNIADEFRNRFDLIGSSSDLIEKQISLFEEAGQIIGESFYQSQIASAQKQKATLEEEKAALIKQLTSSISGGIIQKGTDEWLEMVNTIQEVDGSILECDQSIEQLQNSVLELADKAFERLQNRFKDLESQMESIAGMIDGDEFKVSDEQGIWSDEGLTRLGLVAQQYELHRRNVEEYQEEIDRVNKAYADGAYSTTEYLDKISELTQAQWSEADAAQSAKESIVDLNKARVEEIKNGIQKELDAQKKLIDERKKAISQEKEMRDWEKTLAEKDKAIAKLRNRISLLANDDSAAANAERIKLQQELQDALDDLEETQYEHSVQAQQDALDQHYEDFEEEKNEEIKKLEEYLEDVNLVFKDSLEVIKANTEVIYSTIAHIAEEHGTYVSETIMNAWASGEDAIAAYGETLNSETSSFIGQLDEVEGYLDSLVTNANATADALVNVFDLQADNLLNQFDEALNSVRELTTATELLNQALVTALSGGHASSTIGSIQQATTNVTDASRTSDDKTDNTVTNNGKKPSTTQQQSESQKKEQQIRELEQSLRNLQDDFYNYEDYKNYYNPYSYSYTDKIRELEQEAKFSLGAGNKLQSLNKAIKELNDKSAELRDKLKNLRGYAKGVRNLKNAEIAWTQEERREAILSPSRNAILTKLNKGDSVLTAKETDNLFKWGKLSPDVILKNGAMLNVAAGRTPTLSIGNVVTVNGNIDDTNIQKMQAVATSAINKAFKKFSDEIIKR